MTDEQRGREFLAGLTLAGAEAQPGRAGVVYAQVGLRLRQHLRQHLPACPWHLGPGNRCNCGAEP